MLDAAGNPIRDDKEPPTAPLDIASKQAPGLTATYSGKFPTKGPESGAQRLAYRSPYSNTSFMPGSTYTAYNSGMPS